MVPMDLVSRWKMVIKTKEVQKKKMKMLNKWS